MSGISGYPSQEKLVNPLVGYDSQDSKTSSQFVTVSENHTKKVLLDSKIHGYFRVNSIAKSIASVDATYPKQVIKATGHGASKGDFIRFELSTANPHFEARVISVPDANTLIIGSVLPSNPSVSDEFFVLRSIVPLYDSTGALNVASGPIQFVRDGVSQQVVEDTGTPANNRPLPVKLTGITGDITITAQNLDVQATHTGANPDSMQIGDGTNLLGITALNEAKVSVTSSVLPTGAATETTLSTLNGKVTACDTGNVTVASSALPTGAATLTEQQTQTTALGTINTTLGSPFQAGGSIGNTSFGISGSLPAGTNLLGSVGIDQTTPGTTNGVVVNSSALPTGAATETTLSTLNGKVTACDTGNVTVASSALPTGASTLTEQQTQTTALGSLTETAPATDTASSGLNGRLQRIAQRITSLIALLPISLGQKGMANSFAVTIASDQSALPISAIPAGTNMIGAIKPQGLTVSNNPYYKDYTLGSVTTAAYTEIIAAASETQMFDIFDSSGQAMILAFGGAGAEVDKYIIPPGGASFANANIPVGTRLSLKAKTANATTGIFILNTRG